MSVPAIDIGPALRAPESRDCTSLVVDELRAACEDTGFPLVKGHGVAAHSPVVFSSAPTTRSGRVTATINLARMGTSSLA
jgi:hypothetical protein